MFGLKKLRFVDLGTGLSMMIGTAGLLVASALHAADPESCVPAPSRPVIQGGGCCDKIFEDAAERLKYLHPSVSCTTAEAMCAAPAGAANSCVSTASGCTSDGAAAAAATPWGLTDVFTDDCGKNHVKDHGWKIGGNLAQSFTWNFQNPTDRYNGPVTWTDRSNEYQLNQFWLYAEKATNTTDKDWDIGGRVDVNYGTNSRLFTESGLEHNINGSNQQYGLAFPQFYAEVAYKKLKIKAGHFISPIGYYTVDTTQNFFNTIPYTYQWGEPFTHTGALATYQFTDNFIASAGVIRGWDNFDNHNPHAGFLGTWGYTFKDKSNLAQVLIYSLEPNANFAFSPRYYQSLVYTRPVSDNLTYVGQSDFGTQESATGAGGRANWYGINQYLYYKVSDKWTWGANFEWWRDEEGYRVAGFLPVNSVGPVPSGIFSNQRGFPTNRSGYAGNFYQTTIGPRWYPTGNANFFVRPNLRIDWFDGTSTNGGGANLRPYDSGNKNYQGLLVTDVVWIF